jgi:hypothetical protein
MEIMGFMEITLTHPRGLEYKIESSLIDFNNIIRLSVGGGSSFASPAYSHLKLTDGTICICKESPEKIKEKINAEQGF